MASKYYAIVTDLGTSKMLRAIKDGKKVNVTHIAVGDGEGEYYKPTAEMTALKNELWRGEVNSCRISEESENLLIIESVIPSDAGGFTVREMAAFDEEGEMIAICNTPDTQKVRVSDGVAHELKLAIEVALSNTDSVQLIIDPNVVTATKKDIEELRIAFEKELEAQKNMGTTGAYRENVKYKVGDYCLYENNLYKCLQDTEGEWNPDCWQQTTPLDEIEQLRGTINSLAMIIGTDEEGNLRQLGEAAFAGIANNRTTTEPGFAADARQLKDIQDVLDAQNSASVLFLGMKNIVENTDSSTTEYAIPDGYRKIIVRFATPNNDSSFAFIDLDNFPLYCRLHVHNKTMQYAIETAHITWNINQDSIIVKMTIDNKSTYQKQHGNVVGLWCLK